MLFPVAPDSSCTDIRSDRPRSAVLRRSISTTSGRSKTVNSTCDFAAARALEFTPSPPPTSKTPTNPGQVRLVDENGIRQSSPGAHAPPRQSFERHSVPRGLHDQPTPRQPALEIAERGQTRNAPQQVPDLFGVEQARGG